MEQNCFQIQHLLKLNKDLTLQEVKELDFQIQHLLKLNLGVLADKPTREISNTTLVKVKYIVPILYCLCKMHFKYNTC